MVAPSQAPRMHADICAVFQASLIQSMPALAKGPALRQASGAHTPRASRAMRAGPRGMHQASGSPGSPGSPRKSGAGGGAGGGASVGRGAARPAGTADLISAISTCNDTAPPSATAVGHIPASLPNSCIADIRSFGLSSMSFIMLRRCSRITSLSISASCFVDAIPR